MPVTSTIVTFISRAARIVGALCIFLSFMAVAIQFFSGPDVSLLSASDLFATFEPSITLYFLPGLFLFVSGTAIKSGHRWAAVMILMISILSLFKLVLLLTNIPGPLIHPPLACEIPARIACIILSIPCALAWEDLSEMSRTRSRHTIYGPIPEQSIPPSGRTYPATPPPKAKTIRRPIRPEDPPSSQTPWS